MTAAVSPSSAMIARLPTPPMLPGPPLIGHALDFRRDALGLFRRGYERFGPVFGIRLAMQPAVVLVGPEYNRFFFEQTDRLLSMGEVYRYLDPIIGDRQLYVDEMVKEMEEWLATLGDSGELDLVETAESITSAPKLARLHEELIRGYEFVQPNRRDDFLQALLAGHLEWSLVQLLQHAAPLERVTKEVDAVFGREHRPDIDELQSLQWLEWSLKETERMRPVTHSLLRRVSEDYEANGYRVPKGWLTVAGIALSQRLPAFFRDPERYDPGRFAPERGEDRPYAVVGYGGAEHQCWARAFVTLELKIIIGMLLARYHLALVRPNVRGAVNDIGVIRPARPCLMRYWRRTHT